MDESNEELPPITELARAQRRVLGVLVEKAYTTAEYYPLTLKALTTGCNQKSNRSPVTNYSEEQVFDIVEELAQLGLAGVVHTESGRTERFRHYMRKRFSFTEPQLAILTELLLRGRQQLGELRSRASRMVSIESQDDLRNELRGLAELGYLQASGSLERRGIEVDHALYAASENMQLQAGNVSQSVKTSSPREHVEASSGPQENIREAGEGLSGRLENVEQSIGLVQLENQNLRQELEQTREELEQVKQDMEDLRRALGG